MLNQPQMKTAGADTFDSVRRVDSQGREFISCIYSSALCNATTAMPAASAIVKGEPVVVTWVEGIGPVATNAISAALANGIGGIEATLQDVGIACKTVATTDDGSRIDVQVKGNCDFARVSRGAAQSAGHYVRLVVSQASDSFQGSTASGTVGIGVLAPEAAPATRTSNSLAILREGLASSSAPKVVPTKVRLIGSQATASTVS